VANVHNRCQFLLFNGSYLEYGAATQTRGCAHNTAAVARQPQGPGRESFVCQLLQPMHAAVQYPICIA
jgi:hypothetical protein